MNGRYIQLESKQYFEVTLPFESSFKIGRGFVL